MITKNVTYQEECNNQNIQRTQTKYSKGLLRNGVKLYDDLINVTKEYKNNTQ